MKAENFKTSFDLSEIEPAYEEFIKASRLGLKCRLILSLHDYSKGLWLEFKENKLAKGEDFILADSHNIIRLERERMQWSMETFTEATALSSLKKLRTEVDEIEYDIQNGEKRPEEYADALMCLFDSAGRQGITPQVIFKAFESKLDVNKKRVWKKNPDNSYSHQKA